MSQLNTVNIGNSLTVSTAPSGKFSRKYTFKHVAANQWEFISASPGFVMLLTTNQAKVEYNKLLEHPQYVTHVTSPNPKNKKARIN